MPYFSARLDFPSPPLSVPGSPRMGIRLLTTSARLYFCRYLGPPQEEKERGLIYRTAASNRAGGGGDELVNRSYRDRAADDLGHRDVTRNLSREL